jgi:hypothetical protein
MAATECPEYRKLKDRDKQTYETWKYCESHPEELGPLLSKIASQRYKRHHLDAKQECISHIVTCPKCRYFTET